MICKFCGKTNPDNANICGNCGNPLTDAPAYPRHSAQQPYDSRYPRHAAPTVPPEYKPLSPWAYFGYQLLFAIPLVGFILLIVFSCGGTSNINLKNYARSYWCSMIIALIVIVVLVVLLLVTGGLASLSEYSYY